MNTLRGKAVVDSEGTLTLCVPEELPPGEYVVELTVLECLTHQPATVDGVAREDLYGNWVR